MLGYNFRSHLMSVRRCSRAHLTMTTVAKMRKPVLITHGADDRIVKPVAVEQHKIGLPHAEIHLMANAGHARFWDDAASFNQRLRSFAEGLQDQASSRAGGMLA